MADKYQKEILRLDALFRQHAVTQQEILGAFYDFLDSDVFDPQNEKHQDLRAAVAAMDTELQDQSRSINELRSITEQLREDLLASNKRIDELEAKMREQEAKWAEQEYLRILGEGIYAVRQYVAFALGLEGWGSLSNKLFVEKHAAAQPFRAKIGTALQQFGLDLADWDSMTAVAQERNEYCHPGSAVTSAHLYHVAKNQKPPPSVASHQPNLVRVMLYLKTRNNGL